MFAKQQQIEHISPGSGHPKFYGSLFLKGVSSHENQEWPRNMRSLNRFIHFFPPEKKTKKNAHQKLMTSVLHFCLFYVFFRVGEMEAIQS